MTTLEQAAKDIILTLQKHGFQALYVGGCVRDMLLGLKLSDYDLATSATPEEIQKIFPKTIPVGIQFGIIIVVHHGHNFEVATFREDKDYIDGRHPSMVVRSTIEEDVKRRDFTINGLYFDPIKNEIIDLISGREDIKRKVVKAIGDPLKRFEEDRLRMIRAARYAACLNFSIDPDTKKAIHDMASTVTSGVSVERIFAEFEKMNAKDALYQGLKTLNELHLLDELLPQLKIQKEKKENLVRLKTFNHKIPLICAFIILLDIQDAADLDNLITFLKTSNENRKIGQRFLKIRNHGSLTNLEFAELFSDPLIEELIFAQSLLEKNQDAFIHLTHQKMHSLEAVTNRIKNKDPIISAEDLIARSIPKGPKIRYFMTKAMQMLADHPSLTKEKILETILKDTNPQE